MASPSQYSFELKEVAIALVKEAGIHDGVWAIGFEFALGAGIFGAAPTADGSQVMPGGPSPEPKPGAFMQIGKVQLTRHEAGMPAPPFSVDAAVVNPATKVSKPKQPT